ncbi:hypothetical protein DL770_004906 [Monosporascus sp. CRB-9-2]|nr:hypothetical protein DL770_004906 [Monosporascus sp. CRB-9-2]
MEAHRRLPFLEVLKRRPGVLDNGADAGRQVRTLATRHPNPTSSVTTQPQCVIEIVAEDPPESPPPRTLEAPVADPTLAPSTITRHIS